MRIKVQLEVVDMGEELIAVPVGADSRQFKGVLKLNKEGAIILDLLQTDMNEDEVVAYLAERFDNDTENIHAWVHSFIQQLEACKLIEN